MSTTLNDVKGILQDEMGLCPKCHDHTPCGCEINIHPNSICKKCDADCKKYYVGDCDFLEKTCLVCGSESTSIEIMMNKNTCWNCDTPLT